MKLFHWVARHALKKRKSAREKETLKTLLKGKGGFMAESINSLKTISPEDILKTEIIVNQALIDILIAKQIISEDELIDSIRNIKKEQEKLRNESNKIVSFKQL